MPKTLTIRLNDQEAIELQQLIEEHPNINTASKMLLHSMKRYQQLTETVKLMDEKIEHLEHREAVLTKIIDEARKACAIVVDRTAQRELLEDF